MRIVNKVILLLTAHLAGYQIVFGIDNYDSVLIYYYTIFFGILLIACLLLLIFGFDILENKMIVVVSTLLPLSFSLALIYLFYYDYHNVYLIFCTIGIILIFFSRYFFKAKIATIILATVHGIAGILIFFVPIILITFGNVNSQIIFVSIGGTLIGISGLLLAFLKIGKPILSKEKIYILFPGILFFTTLSFMIGMHPGQ